MKVQRASMPDRPQSKEPRVPVLLPTEQRAVLLLREAAAEAGKQPTLRRAINCSWGWIHREGPEVMAVAFRLWCASGRFGGWAGDLAGVFRPGIDLRATFRHLSSQQVGHCPRRRTRRGSGAGDRPPSAVEAAQQLHWTTRSMRDTDERCQQSHSPARPLKGLSP
jgi:hypothetical protein